MNHFQKYAAPLVIAIGLIGHSGEALAVHFEIVDVVNLSGNGFTSTVFHTSSGCGGTCGSILETAVEGSGGGSGIGEYNPNTGGIFFSFDLASGNRVSASGNVLFPGNIDNVLLGTIRYKFDNVLTKDGDTLFGGQKTFDINYLDHLYGSVPNSFDSANLFMALWGSSADPLTDSDGDNTGFFELGGLGSDLRFDLRPGGGGPGHTTVIPLPAALPLYGTGIAVMGFIGWRRKRKTAVST